jgi:hypothetical protein
MAPAPAPSNPSLSRSPAIAGAPASVTPARSARTVKAFFIFGFLIGARHDENFSCSQSPDASVSFSTAAGSQLKRGDLLIYLTWSFHKILQGLKSRNWRANPRCCGSSGKFSQSGQVFSGDVEKIRRGASLHAVAAWVERACFST